MRFSRFLFPTLLTVLLAMPNVADTEDNSDNKFDQTPRRKISFDGAPMGESTHNKLKGHWVGIFDSAGLAQTCIKLDKIVSVSIQSYSLDGSVSITECTIDTQGNNSIRIYGSRSDQIQKTRDKLANTRQMIDKKANNLTRYPSKKFPEGAYSHNAEFQLETAEEVKQVYQSVLNAWVKNEGCVMRIH